MPSLPTDQVVQSAALRLRASLVSPGLRQAVAAYFRDPGFAGMTFSELGSNPPYEIVADDLLAVSLLDITWRPQVVRILLVTHKRELSRLLAEIPRAVDLWDATDDDLRSIDLMWDALISIEGIGTASATKILARKRPRVCPISDSLVIKAVDVPGRTWDVLRCLLQDPLARTDVEALRPPEAATASLLRVLDVALWVSHSKSAAAQQVRVEAGLVSVRSLSDDGLATAIDRHPIGQPKWLCG
jgi:transposase